MVREKVFDRFTNPRNVGEIEDASSIGKSATQNAADV